MVSPTETPIPARHETVFGHSGSSKSRAIISYVVWERYLSETAARYLAERTTELSDTKSFIS